MPEQLLFQYAARLDEQTTVNRLVGHTHALIIGILGLQPSSDLFRRPIQAQFTRDDPLQRALDAQQARLRTQRCLPGTGICIGGSIVTPATVTGDLAAHRGR